MTNDFESKLADLVWSLIEPKIDQKLTQFREDNDIGSIDLDDKISDWMSGNFRLDDYQFDLDGMIDAQLQYQAEDGDLKDWLKHDDPDADVPFDTRVFRAINNNYNIQLIRR